MYDQPPPQQVYEFHAGNHFLLRSILGSIIKIPIPTKGGMTYAELQCSEQDRAYIYEIITTMAENGKFSLLLNQSHLRQIGAEIDHVHPLKFLSTIFSNPKLKRSMMHIFDDYFKRNGFLGGLIPNLNREAERGKLIQYAEDFAKDVHISTEIALHYFHSRDWEEFVRYLMNH